VDKMRENRLEMVWTCNEVSGIKSIKSGYENERGREKRKSCTFFCTDLDNLHL